MDLCRLLSRGKRSVKPFPKIKYKLRNLYVTLTLIVTEGQKRTNWVSRAQIGRLHDLVGLNNRFYTPTPVPEVLTVQPGLKTVVDVPQTQNDVSFLGSVVLKGVKTVVDVYTPQGFW